VDECRGVSVIGTVLAVVVVSVARCGDDLVVRS